MGRDLSTALLPLLFVMQNCRRTCPLHALKTSIALGVGLQFDYKWFFPQIFSSNSFKSFLKMEPSQTPLPYFLLGRSFLKCFIKAFSAHVLNNYSQHEAVAITGTTCKNFIFKNLLNKLIPSKQSATRCK